MNVIDDFWTERVAKGALHLDQIMPDWFEKIDFNTLVMENGDRCIAGQLGLRWARLTDETGATGAFSGSEAVPYWKREVYRRKNASIKVSKKKERVLA